MPVSDRDNGYRERLRKVLDMRSPRAALVGVQGAKAAAIHEGPTEAGGPQTIGDIATEHELGLGVPERSFLRAYCDANDPQIRAWLREAATRVVAGRSTIDREVGIIGARIQAGMQEFIASGMVEPPLHPSTIARKGSSTPLIDTGQLKSAITWAIEKALTREISSGFAPARG